MAALQEGGPRDDAPGARGGAATDRPGRPVPAATVARLPGYLGALAVLAERGVVTTSSGVLAQLTGVSPAQLRKDLSFLGTRGLRGVGYDVAHLTAELGCVLGLTRERRAVIVGVGNLGRALAGYPGFSDRGFVVAGLVDADPAVVGSRVAGLEVEPLARLAAVVEEHAVTIAVIATPADVAQDVCDLLVAAGVSGILTFAPRALRVPPEVDLRAVDLGSELQILAFHDRRRAVAGN